MRPERIERGPGQESVWDYPRPPRLERTSSKIEVELGGIVIAETTQAWRVLETSHPPSYYIPRSDIQGGHLIIAMRTSFCEWKGRARFISVRAGDQLAEMSGWFYPSPSSEFESIRDHVAFYPSAMDTCRVDGEIVIPQPGGFYGGWITSNIVGPFKGVPDSDFW